MVGVLPPGVFVSVGVLVGVGESPGVLVRVIVDVRVGVMVGVSPPGVFVSVGVFVGVGESPGVLV